jgi:hypothetical protein
MLRAAPEVSRVWPGYWPREQGILLLREEKVALLASSRKPPAEFTSLSAPNLPPELRRRLYVRASYPDEFTKGRFSLSHALGNETVPALPVRGSELSGQLEFLYHEAFHGYQSRGGFKPVAEDQRQARFGERLVDSALVEAPAFQSGAEAERRLLLAALDLPQGELRDLFLGHYLASRRARTGHLADVRAVERRMERTEGTAEFVGCRATALATGGGEISVRTCIRKELGRPMSDMPGMPEADARWMRWRLYGTGAALTYLLDQLGTVPDWQQRVAQGDFLDDLLGEAITRRRQG